MAEVYLFLGLLVSLTGQSLARHSLCNPGGDWELVLNDEFEGTELNTSLWTARTSEEVGHANELQYYSPYNVEVKGVLHSETVLVCTA